MLMVVSRVWFLGYTPGGLVQQCAWTFPQDGQLNVVGHIIPNESRVCSLGVGDLIITSYVSKVKRNITSFHWLMPSNAQGSSTEQQHK